MNGTINFKQIENQEEFFDIFQGLCTIAQNAFKEVESELEAYNSYEKIGDTFYQNISQLMSIVIVIRGMRGDYQKFNRKYMEDRIFYIEVDGVQYDQSYLYKMNDHFSKKLIKLLEFIEQVNPEYAKAYNLIHRLS